jgi:hypothetical protein
LTAGYLVSKGDTNTLVFTWNVPQAGQTDLALTGTATAKATLTVSSPATPTTKIAGFAVYDVAAINAAGANTDTEIAVYSEVSLWADAIVWAADATETITLPNGSTKAVTAFNTGAAYGSGNMSVADLKTLKAKRLKLVEGTEFDCLGFRNPGDYV